MNKLSISPVARDDLAKIRQYITEELESPTAADNTLRKIIKRIRSLEQQAEIGFPLSSIVEFETNYRVLVCGSYLTFYRIEHEEVFIDRVLYGRRDYLKILFGVLPEENN